MRIVGPKGERTFTPSELAALPRVSVTVSDHGKDATFEGVELFRLLEQVGVPDGEHLRGKEIAQYILIEAADGYSAVFAIAELSPAFSPRRVILALRRDGKTLSDQEGPFRIAVEGEKRMARNVRQVKTIRVIGATK